jgi:hypothetical protein
MKPIALIILALTLAIGTYMVRNTKSDAQVMIEDSIGSSMAAPVRPDIPL